MPRFERKKLSAEDARFEAQKLAFGPVAFQVARVAKESGVLAVVARVGSKGATVDDVRKQVRLSPYAVATLLESALGLQLVDEIDPGVYVLGSVGYFVLYDEMTQANMAFVQDVCYAGMEHLGEALEKGAPAGLKVFGPWPTIYEGLSALPEHVQKSWFAFDHLYSDSAFPEALRHVLASGPRRILDIGGNTARWALSCAQANPDVTITILDLPGQLEKARRNIAGSGMESRIELEPIDLLDPEQAFPSGRDVIWMSQLLVCFSEEEIQHIVGRAAQAMAADSSLFILDNFWDLQKHEVSAYVIQQTSVYFTCLANGNSRMYRFSDFVACLEQAGVRIADRVDDLGWGHTLLRCVRQ